MIGALDYFKDAIFNKENKDFINIIKVLLQLWNRGQKSEDEASTIIKKYFGDRVSIGKTSGAGKKTDAIGGIDLVLTLDGLKHSAQVKPFSEIKIEDGTITVLNTGDVKPYKVDWMIFINYKTEKVLVFKNDPIQDRKQYVFNESSLIYEIN